jgi:hypothetical protein
LADDADIEQAARAARLRDEIAALRNKVPAVGEEPADSASDESPREFIARRMHEEAEQERAGDEPESPGPADGSSS